MRTKKECALHFAFGEGFKLAKITTHGVGLTMSQQFEALKSGGFDKKFVNECLVRTALKKGVEGFELLSTDFKHKAFVSKDKVLKIIVLADDLKGLKTQRKQQKGEVFLSENRGTNATRSEIECVNSSSERGANAHDLRQKDKPQVVA